jgi:carboxyl-terminal processing protease
VKKIFFFFSFLLITTISAGKKEITTAQKASTILKTIQKYHYKPRAVDDSLSSLIFDLFLESLDSYGCFFTKEIVEHLERYRFEIDEQIKNQNTVFLDTTTTFFKKQLRYADSLIKTFGKKELDCTHPDTLWLGGAVEYVKTASLFQRWENWIKYMVVWSYESQRDSSDTIINLTKQKTLELTKDALSWETCKIDRYINSSESIISYIEEQYLKAIANAFDPHTDFLSAQERTRRRDELSKTSGLFGISVDQNVAGGIEIKEVIPGSPAWNCNKINEGDVILSIKKSDGTMLELRCISISEVEEFLSGIDHKQAVFKIRKKSGPIIDIPLQKELIDVKQNIIRSFILKGNRKIGYIYLPSFYTEFYYGSYFSQGCASDLSKELLKLKSDSISGLILDLRGNGGGLVAEALRIAGLFIDYGGLSVIHERGKAPIVQKDDARGTVYDGPLLVLVNSASASASELLASTLQDHNRAIIAGSTTFGKGTMQSVLPYDAGNFDSLSMYKGTPVAFLSVTTGAIYRATGTSTQCKGVIPDIVLPDLLQNSLLSESTQKAALHFDTITKKVYYYPSSPLPLQELKNKSVKRIKGSRPFQYIQKKQLDFPDLHSRYPVPLQIHSFVKFMDNFEEVKDSLSQKNTTYSVNQPRLKSCADNLPKNEQDEIKTIIKDIQDDIYINEVFMVLDDLLSISGKVLSNDKK